MKTRLILIAIVLFTCGTTVAHAQLTVGQTTAKVIRTGNRAAAGDFGLYLGATSSMFYNIFRDDVDFTPLPLFNFKYMATDGFEIRVGLELYNASSRVTGVYGEETALHGVENISRQNEFTVYPGFAYHFSRLNILDVYVGLEIPLGVDASSTSSDSIGEIRIAETISKRSFVVGLGAFIGLQAYIADLPLAIGMEYGLASRLDTNLKYKHVSTFEDETTTIYTADPDMIEGFESYNFNNLTARKGEIGGQLRLTLSYYFK